MDLFGNETECQIPGLKIIPDYITSLQEEELIESIDNELWLTDLKRRVQHYGYKYDYKARRITDELKIGQLPEWIEPYVKKLVMEKFFSNLPDQVIVNEYEPGQGISPHIDCIPCFSETIASISLGSQCVMEFTNPQFANKITTQLAPRSLLVLSGDARYKWLHSIPQRKNDKVSGKILQRQRRISLTFRKVITG